MASRCLLWTILSSDVKDSMLIFSSHSFSRFSISLSDKFTGSFMLKLDISDEENGCQNIFLWNAGPDFGMLFLEKYRPALSKICRQKMPEQLIFITDCKLFMWFLVILEKMCEQVRTKCGAPCLQKFTDLDLEGVSARLPARSRKWWTKCGSCKQSEPRVAART